MGQIWGQLKTYGGNFEMTLTLDVVKASKPRLHPFKLYDKLGLFLMVTPAGGKWWRFRYRFDGKEKLLSLGIYPNVSLKEARKRRDTLRALLIDGINPSEHTKVKNAAQRDDEARQIAVTRFMLDNDGALSFRLGNHRMTLTPAETSELRTFLDGTRAISPKVTP
ncbi:MAG: Arm DNA-binding domain-containing protein [Gallionella sp.]